MGVDIILSNIVKQFDDKPPVINNISLNFKAGEIYIIFGTSGTGKSVLFRLISAFEEVTSGNITIGDLNLKEINEDNYTQKMSSVGVLFQDIALFDSLTIWENVAFYHLYNLNIDKEEARQIALANLRQVGLNENVMELLPSQISGGMAKRVGIARVIARKPQVLLFDEPTSGLDPILTTRINSLIAKVAKELNATTLVVTHDINVLNHFKGKVIFLNKGKVIWNSDVEAFANSADPAIQQFLKGEAEGELDI